jgi:hypothetical protein
MVKISSRIQIGDLLTQDNLEPLEVLIGLGELRSCVAKEVLHVRYGVAHVDRERSAVFPSGKTEHVS